MSLSQFKFQQRILYNNVETTHTSNPRCGAQETRGVTLSNEDGSETFAPWWNIIYIHTDV